MKNMKNTPLKKGGVKWRDVWQNTTAAGDAHGTTEWSARRDGFAVLGGGNMRHIFGVLGFLLFLVSVGWASAGHDRHHQIQANTSPSNAFHTTRARESAKSLFFLDSAKGWVIANGVLYGTANGGKNWGIINQRSLQD